MAQELHFICEGDDVARFVTYWVVGLMAWCWTTEPLRAQRLFSFEDGTTEGWTPSIVPSGFDDPNSQLTVVNGPGNTDGDYSLQVIGKAGGFVRNVSVILDPDRVSQFNQAIENKWNLAFDWTVLGDENPGGVGYLAQLSIASTPGWSQLDMNSLNGYPVWDNTGPNEQTMSPSIPLADFGGATLGLFGVPLDPGSTVYVINIALSANGESLDKRTYYLDNFRLVDPNATVPGDFNGNGTLDLSDLDSLTKESARATNAASFDLNSDQLVDFGDIQHWVNDLKKTWIGDADLNGEFDSNDLVTILVAGTYEANVDSVWSTGDFNGDGRTDSGDLVAALVDGGYELGPRAATFAVPEPSSLTLLMLGALASRLLRKRAR